MVFVESFWGKHTNTEGGGNTVSTMPEEHAPTCLIFFLLHLARIGKLDPLWEGQHGDTSSHKVEQMV